MHFNATIESIIFQNNDNGYTVLEVSTDDNLYTAVGVIPPVAEGEHIEIEGTIKEHPKYGEQIAISSIKKSLPDNKDGMIRFLSSDLFTGVGEVTATLIVEKFGDSTFKVIENEPARLSEVKGVSIKRAMQIADSYEKNKQLEQAIVVLAKYEISVNIVIKLYKAYGERTIETVENNPYVLIDDIEGIGFYKADKIAMSLGIDRDSKFRVRAGITYILKEVVVKNGHTHLPKEMLIDEVLSLLELERDYEGLVVDTIDEMEVIGKVVLIDTGEYTAVVLAGYFIAEKSIATRLNNMLANTRSLDLDVENDIREYERINHITLHANQKKAIENCLVGGVNIITGGPGTGKTTIVKCIISILKTRGAKVALCAPTGRAAKRLSETTGENAKTIHRLLDLDFKNGKDYFASDNSFELEADVVIVDEVSMCDEYVFNSLIKSIKWGSRLIMVGDKDQLPSVGAGNVLADIIASDVIPVSYLTQIYRQSDDTGLIIENAHRINRGEMPIFDNTKTDFFYDNKSSPEDIMNAVVSMVTTRIPAFRGVSSSDIQVLCPMKKGRSGVDYLNIRLQDAINPADNAKKEIHIGNNLLREGDKVIHTMNNYELSWTRYDERGEEIEVGSGVFNGDIGIVESIVPNTREVVVRFDDNRVAKYASGDLGDLSLAYAISVHKSQGSEFPIVVVAVSSGTYKILTRNLLYTAVTRAKDMLVLIGDKGNIQRMVENNYTQKRYTFLTEFIYEEYQRR